MTRLNWRLCGGLAKIQSVKVENYTLTNNYFFNSIKLHTSRLLLLQLNIFRVLQFFIQHSESNAINNEHFMRMFTPNVFDLIAFRCILMCVISLFIISDSK